MTLLWLLGAGIAGGIGWWVKSEARKRVSEAWVLHHDRAQWRAGNPEQVCWNWTSAPDQLRSFRKSGEGRGL